MSKTKNADKKFNITVPLQISYQPGRKENFMHISFADMCARLKDEDDKEIGSIRGCLGMGIEFELKEDGRVFYVDAKSLWNAFVAMLDKPEFIYEAETEQSGK